MATALFPVVDLRALSQSDLAALAAASSPHAVDPRRHPDSDVLPPSKIDRAIFNESAGSRKQTFSRLRHSSSPSSDLATSSSATPAEDNSENHLIVSHLRRLFAGEDPSFPAPPPPQPLTPAAPPESSLPPPPRPPPPDPDREAINPKGVFLDLARLAELVDPYGEELRRRTAGLGPESELLGFMNGLEGQWGSRRRRRKFVDAAAFGDHLPRGWKLLLGLKRKEGVAWINCRRYVSPKGHQFVTCKEVSSYLMSLLGYPEAKTAAVENSLAGLHDLSADDSVGFKQQIGSTEEKQSALPIKQIGSTEEKQNVLPITSATLSGQTGDSEKQRSLRKDEGRVATNAQECQKCNLTFCDQSAYVQHQLSFHQKSAKRRRVGKPGEPVVRNDGKFESQERGRTSEERSDHFGHVGAHVTHQEPSSATSFHKASPGKAGSQSSLAALPCGLQEMTDSPEHTKERTAGEPNSGHQSVSSKVLEFASTNSKNFNRPDETCCRPEEVVPTSDAPSTTKYTNTVSPNVHQSDSSKVLEVSSTNSKNVNRPDKTCCRSEEVVPTTDAPSTSKYTNDPMNCADVTELKQVPQSSDLLDGKFNCFAEVTGFNDPAESNLLSATLEVPNPKSVDLEVDDGNVSCKYGEVAKCTSFENDYTDEDQIIDCDMAASNDEINNDVKIQDVNLNSCLDISSPIDGANYELSNSPDDGNQSSIADKCFGASFNDDNACKAESFVNQNSAGKAGTFVNQNSAMVYQSNLRMEPIYPRQINVDGFPSCSISSEITNNVQEREDNVKEQLGNTHNISSNEAGFDVEAYNSDIFGGAIAESNLAQLNNTISDLKADFSSCYSLSDLNTLTHGTAAEEIDVNCMRGSFVNGSVGRNGPNEHCTLDFDIKGSMLEAMKKSDNELENQYNGGAPGCDSLATAGTSGNINELMSMQVNFGSLSSLVRSVADVPMGSMIQDQCDLQLGFGGQKQMFPGFEDLRLASAGSSQFGSMTRHNSVPVPEPTLMLGYAPQLGSCPQVQLGWDLGLPKMVSGCMLTSVCVWCNNQFHHFGNVAEQQADSVGFICPACKEKISGHLSMLNNGSSL